MVFRKINLTLLFLTCVTACSNNVDVEHELALSREVSMQLGSQLKNKLINAMQSGGPGAAISICNIDAMPITAEVSKRNNLKVGRTSLKLRNTNNQPDNWEKAQLKIFASEKDAGTEVKTLEAHEVIEENNKKVFRYMKAIPTQEPCLLCHGKTLAPEIEEKIKSLYPYDQATGYELGEIRGAFTIEIAL